MEYVKFVQNEKTLAFVVMFTKLLKATKTLSFMSISFCPSICMEQLGSHWMDFQEI
jgi:hypothetical protein